MKKQLLIVALLSVTVSCLHAAAAPKQTLSDLQAGINQVFDKLCHIQKEIFPGGQLPEIQQAYFDRLKKKRADEKHDPLALLSIASDFLGVLQKDAERNKKIDLSKDFVDLQSRIQALTRQQKQEEKQQTVGKLPQPPAPAAPSVAPKPKKTPPPVAAKPTTITPLASSEPQRAPSPEPTVQPIFVALPVEEEEDDFVPEAVPVVVEEDFVPEVVPVEEEEPAEETALTGLAQPAIGTSKVSAPSLPGSQQIGVVPAFSPVYPQRVKVVMPVAPVPAVTADMIREADYAQVFNAQMDCASALVANDPNMLDTAVQAQGLFAGVQAVPGFQFLTDTDKDVFDPSKGDIYQKFVTGPAANVVIDLLSSDGLSYGQMQVRILRLGESLNRDVIKGALYAALSQYVKNGLFVGIAAEGIIQNLFNKGYLKLESELSDSHKGMMESLKKDIDNAVTAIFNLNTLYAQQLMFSAKGFQELMEDIQLFREKRVGHKENLQRRIRELMTIEDLQDFDTVLARVLYLTPDQKGVIEDVMREVLDIQQSADAHVAMHALDRDRQAEEQERARGVIQNLLRVNASIQTLEELVESKLIPLNREVELIASTRLYDPEKLLLEIVANYNGALLHELFNVQAKLQRIVTLKEIRDHLNSQYGDYLDTFINVLAKEIFNEQRKNYSELALGRFFYINKKTLIDHPKLLGSLLGMHADVLQKEFQETNPNEEDLFNIVNILLKRYELFDVLGSHTGQIVNYLMNLKAANEGEGYDLVQRFFPTEQ